MSILKSIFFTRRLFILLGLNAFLYVMGYLIPEISRFASLWSIILLVLIAADIILVFGQKEGISANRITPQRLSNGDSNTIYIRLSNHYAFPISAAVIDEIPFQFQMRELRLRTSISPGKNAELSYELTPVQRGEYTFGNINIFIKSLIGLAERRIVIPQQETIPVYPSFLQLKKFELYTVANRLSELGVKKIRRVGHSLEFDQIRSYVPGDDIRTVNWKATAKHSDLMVNLYQDQQSQLVYSLIDRGRTMKMSFSGMTLLDYAINSSLIISGVAMQKRDLAGVLTFSDTITDFVPAARRSKQMNLILEALYHIKTDFYESDFERLYYTIKRRITNRSLLLLYTNLESLSSLNRKLPYLKKLADEHLLVVIFFLNTEIDHLLEEPVFNVEDVYIKTMAEKFRTEKLEIVKKLEQNGIHAILTTPEQLTIQTINKYLELKLKNRI